MEPGSVDASVQLGNFYPQPKADYVEKAEYQEATGYWIQKGFFIVAGVRQAGYKYINNEAHAPDSLTNSSTTSGIPVFPHGSPAGIPQDNNGYTVRFGYYKDNETGTYYLGLMLLKDISNEIPALTNQIGGDGGLPGLAK